MIKVHHKKRKVLPRTNYLDDSASAEHSCGLGGCTFIGSFYQAIKFGISHPNYMVQYREHLEKTPQQRSLSL